MTIKTLLDDDDYQIPMSLKTLIDDADAKDLTTTPSDRKENKFRKAVKGHLRDAAKVGHVAALGGWSRAIFKIGAGCPLFQKVL